jgi:hypothetical protein
MGMKLPAELESKVLDLARQSEPPLPAKIDEKDFMAAVVALAKKRGFLVYHPFDSRKSTAGFPDLVLVRERVIFAELKTDIGKTTADQERWIEGLGYAKAEVHLWRPEDWAEIERLLA